MSPTPVEYTQGLSFLQRLQTDAASMSQANVGSLGTDLLTAVAAVVTGVSSYGRLHVNSFAADFATIVDQTISGSLSVGTIEIASNTTFSVISTTAIAVDSLVQCTIVTEVASVGFMNTFASSRVAGISFMVNAVPAISDQAVSVSWQFPR